ncbi:hypothetical protein B0H13DRAFT_1910390, partial [Mycena leptocephala]
MRARFPVFTLPSFLSSILARMRYTYLPPGRLHTRPNPTHLMHERSGLCELADRRSLCTHSAGRSCVRPAHTSCGTHARSSAALLRSGEPGSDEACYARMRTGGCARDVGEEDGPGGLGAEKEIGWRRRMCISGSRAGWVANPELGVRAVHPVSWSISPPSSTASSALPTAAASTPAPATPEAHPGPPTPPPPTYALAEAAHNAHVKSMRTVLLPIFENVVRRLIV